MSPAKRYLGCTALLLCLSGCAAHHGSRYTQANQFVTEFYAFVENVRSVEFESNVGPSIAYGALHGAVEGAYYGDRHDILAGAIIGGVFSGLITALFEGNTDGYEYQLQAIDGDIVTVVLDYDPANIGDCVRVRVAGSVDVYWQEDEVCLRAYYQD